MARVPTASGFQVSPTVPSYEVPNLVNGGDSLLEKNAQAVEKSSNELSKAVNDAYVRYSDMRVVDKVNDVNTKIKDLLYGQDGALTKKGGAVVNADKQRSFGDIYMEKIQKIVEDAADGLDNGQAESFRRKAAASVLSAHDNLLKHQMTQTEAYRSATYKTDILNASDSIVINGSDINRIGENIKTINSSSDKLNENFDADTKARIRKETASKALVAAVKTQIQIGNIDGAKSIISNFGKDMTGAAVYAVTAELKKATKEASALNLSKQMFNGLVNESQPESILINIAKESNVNVSKDDISEALAESNGDMSFAALRILKGKDVFDKVMNTMYEKELPSDTGIRDLLKETFGDQEAAKISAEVNGFIKKYSDTSEQWRSAKPEFISAKLSESHPEATEQDIAKITTKFVGEANRVRKLNQAQAGAEARAVYKYIQDGIRFEDINPEEMRHISSRAAARLNQFSNRRNDGEITTDATAFNDLYFNISRLKAMSLEEVYASAISFSDADFKKILDRKSQLDSGVDIRLTKEDQINDAVIAAMSSAGLARPSSESPYRRAAYDEIKRQISAMIFYEVNDANNGKMMSPEDVSRKVRNVLNTKFTIANETLWIDRDKTIGSMASENRQGMSSELAALMDAALKADGPRLSSPTRGDRKVQLVKFMITNDLSQFSKAQIHAMYEEETQRQDKNAVSTAKRKLKLNREPTEEEVVQLALESNAMKLQ